MTMIAVAIGCNAMQVTLGVFSNEEVARQKLLEFGAAYKQYPLWKNGKKTKELSKPQLETTKAFVDFMSSKGLDTYSAGAPLEEGYRFQFIPIELNDICIGYNDD